jgi:hypothetical protein
MGKKKTNTLLPLAMLATMAANLPWLGTTVAHAEVMAVQQQQVIRGTVVDDRGEAAIGTTVQVVGGKASQGTVTDLDGNFTINVAPGTKLKITYVGCDSQTVTARDGMKVALKNSGFILHLE